MKYIVLLISLAILPFSAIADGNGNENGSDEATVNVEQSEHVTFDDDFYLILIGGTFQGAILGDGWAIIACSSSNSLCAVISVSPRGYSTEAGGKTYISEDYELSPDKTELTLTGLK
jgi:hypothetical protein